ncbi:MAG TPA: TonB-dependent receptor [Candidatus Acidoferrum sp.]|nr:TonB-dependent receptor [Candidatus Acidoferrum sp.]
MSKQVFAVARVFSLLLVIGLLASAAFAQFSGNIQGIVQDPSGAGVPNAKVTLINLATKISATTTTDSAGNYQFVSLAPGAYQITVDTSGFASELVNVTLETNQTKNVPIPLKVKGVQATVQVTGEAPVLNTADTRNQMTLENQGVAQLPVAGRNMVTLATLAPGVTGLGTTGSGQPGSVGTPGSGVDNYSTETQVDASANGEGQMSNMWVVDGLDVTSGIRQGVLNLTPNPDSIQEMSIQVNTYTAEYGRADGLQVIMNTKSGTDQFHGFADDYFNYQKMFALTEFQKQGTVIPPFHSNNFSLGVGGPIIPHHQFFFFFDVEPQRQSNSANSPNQTFADPQFVSWAQANFPFSGGTSGSCAGITGSLGTCLLSTYAPTTLTNVFVSQTAAQYLGVTSCSGTIAVTGTVSIPCDLPTIDSGTLNATAVRNGTQYFGRVDKYFGNDRIYGSFYRTVLSYGAPTAVPQFSPANDQNWEYAVQGNWSHTFSATTINQATFGESRVEGTLGSGAPIYSVPDVSVSGISADGGSAFGVGFAQGDFIQKNYHWRDVLTHIHGEHTLKFGYEGWYGQDIEPFEGPKSTPSFTFNNLTTLVQDSPLNEVPATYDPATGEPVLWSWNAASQTWGVFGQDTWRAKPNLTLTLGLRYDDSGNPWSDSPTTVFGNFYLGPGSTFQDQVANGFAKATHNALNHSVNNLISPTAGFAWDPTGNGDWVVRGGFGVFNNWLTQANVQEEFRWDPPGAFDPTFFSTGAVKPVFAVGSGNKPPFGFYSSAPSLVGTSLCPVLGTLGCLDSQGGIIGAGINIGAINPNLKSPRADVWSTNLERKIGTRYVANVGYSGSHSYHLVGNGDQAGIVSYGDDINAFPGDLVQNNSLVPTRLNPSFGQIIYTDNDRHGNYEAIDFDIRGRFSHGFFDASYTRSESKDDAGEYPTTSEFPSQYYGPSPWDVPNRFSLTLNYQLPGLNGGQGLVGHLTGGWGISGTSIFQSGYPFTVINKHPFVPTCVNEGPSAPCSDPSASNPITGLFTTSGDYNADGDDFDYPNAASYAQGNSRQAFLNGIFSSGQFTQPTIGTEGTEKQNAFREPNFAETDAAFYKDNRIVERLSLQIRFEFFNIFNRANLGFVDSDPLDPNFGKVTSQQLPRWWQVAARFTF